MSNDATLTGILSVNPFMVFAIPFAAILVFMVHEFGHYFLARIFHVRVDRFSIGLGRVLWQKTDRHGTLWTMHMFPVCGFVHLARDDADRTFAMQSFLRRFLIILAGPAANILLAFVLLFLFFASVGVPSVRPYVAGVQVGAPAAEGGLIPGCHISSINGRTIEYFDGSYDLEKAVETDRMKIAAQCGGQAHTFNITPERVNYRDPDGFMRNHRRIGVVVSDRTISLEGIRTIEGHAASPKMDDIRAEILKYMDRRIVLGIKSYDGKVRDYLVDLNGALNADLHHQNKPGYKTIFFGAERGNFYRSVGAGEAAEYGLREVARISGGLILALGRAWHIDQDKIQPEIATWRDQSPFFSDLYRLVYLSVLLSLIIALINLVPVPGLDGGFILMMIADRVMGVERATKSRGKIIQTTLLILLAILVWRNAGSLPAVLQVQIDKITEKLNGND